LIKSNKNLPLVFVSIFFLFNFVFGISYVGAAAYNASDILGQVDESGDPVFTRNIINNNPIIPGSQGFSDPTHGLIDPVHHRLFVSDSTNYRILIFNLDSANHLIDHTADYVLGKTGFGFDPTPGTSSSTLYTAHGLGFGLAYDPVNDRLFVSNYANNDIMIWDLSSGITNGMPASNVLGATDYDFHPDPVSPTSSNMKGPTGLYYDTTSSQLFVSDFAHTRILIFDLSSGITDGMPATHVLGQADFVSGGFGTSSSKVWSVMDILYDSSSEQFFVADAGNSRVLVWDLSSGITDGMPATHVLGQTGFITRTTGTTSSTLNVAGGLSYDTLSQQLFVGDTYNSRVLIFDLSSGITDGMPASHVLGQTDFVSGGTGTSPSTLSYWVAAGVGLSLGYDTSSSQLVVADNGNNRIMIWDLFSGITDGMPATDMLGQLDTDSNPDYTTNSADYFFEQSINAQGFDGLSDNLIDTVHHRLFVADTGNNRILIFDLDSSNNLIDHTADHVLGQTDFISGTADTTSSTLDYPYGLAYDSVNDYLFISESNNSRVLVFDLSSGITDGMSATHVLGQTDFDSSVCDTTSSAMCFPYGLVYDPSDQQLFVSDSDNSRVLVFDLSSGITDGMSATHVLGQVDFDSSGSGTSSSVINSPRGLTLNATNNQLFVTDTGNNRVLVWDLSSGITDGMSATHVLGQVDFDSSGSGTSSSVINSPRGLALNTTNNQLFVADTQNNRVLIFDLSSGITDGMPASHVLGQVDFDSSGIGTSSSRLWSVVDIFYDSTSSQLFVADSGNSRVLIWDLSSGITNGMSASHVLGQTDFITRTTGTTSSTLNVAGGLSYDALNQKLFVGDTLNNRVLIFDLSSGITDGMLAAHVLGQTDFISAGTGTSSSTLMHWIAAGLGLSLNYDPSSSQLIVADNGNNRIMIWDLSSGITDGMPATNVLGQVDFDSSGSGTSSSIINSPRGLALNTTNNQLFVADTQNNRVLIFDLSSGITDGMPAVGVLGQTDFISADLGLSQSMFNKVSGLSFDSINNRLYVVDSAKDNTLTNNRIMIFNLIKFSTSLPSATADVAYSSNFSSTNNQGVTDYSVVGGSLPLGLTISGSTFSGTPSASGTYSFIIQANDTGDWGVFTDPLSFDFDISENISPGSSGSCRLPTSPEGGFKNLINNGNEKSTSRDIILNLKGGPNTKKMVISNDSSFSNLADTTKQIAYQPSFNWNLCQGAVSCPEGVHTIYVKFYSSCGRASEIVFDSIFYKGTGANITAYSFGSITLKLGSRGEPVKELQRFLNKFLNVSLTVDGKLGPKTLFVVKEWQRNHGLVVDGFVGIKTKLSMNSMVE
jgi:DNA-binding beta-propeller fold protein YncE